MSGSASIGLEQAILGHTLGFAPMPAVTTAFVALCALAPPPTEVTGGAEASGGGYSRVAATFALVDAPSNLAANVASVEWPAATASWGTMGYFELWDSASGGNRLYWGQLLDPVAGTSVTVTVVAGDIVRFSAGALAVQAATGTGGTTSTGAYLPLIGGTLTGPLTLAADPTLPLVAATKQYVDGRIGSGLAGTAIVNVLDHGAYGDGVHDDTAAIQNTLMAFAGKATVFVPDTGNPYMCNGLNLPSGTDMLLFGTIMAQSNAPTHLINFVASATNITIRGHGTLDANGANQGTGLVAGINGTCNNLLISEITIQNSSVWNLNVTASAHGRVDKVRLLGGTSSNQFAVGCDDCWLTGCYINGTSQDEGFTFYGGVTNSGAIGNTVTNAADAAFSVLNDSAQSAPCKNIVIANNICHGCGYGGISVDQGIGGAGAHSAIIIANNRVYNNNGSNGPQGSEINVNFAGPVLISGNVVSDDSAYGANDATHPCAYGIYLTANSANVTLIGNCVFDVGNSVRAGYGLYVGTTSLVQASGNAFHDYRATQYMTGIAGTAGANNAFTDNLFGRLVASFSLVLETDTEVSDLGSQIIYPQSGTGPPTFTARSVGTKIVLYPSLSAAQSDYAFGIAGGTLWASVPASVDSFGWYGGTTLAASLSGSGLLTLAGGLHLNTLPGNYANDAAAAAAGIPVGGMYRNGSVLQVRVT